MKLYIKDWLIINIITLLISAILSAFNGKFLEILMMLIFIESGIALIIGGMYGSIFSSAMSHSKLLRKKEPDKETIKREIKIGKRFAILGFLLLIESFLIAIMI